MAIWVISDTHFNHANIINFKDSLGKPVRGFSSLKEMDECMMDNWNDVVKPQDKVYHLGDVLFGPDKENWLEKNFKKLPGKKRLVLGNHDNPKLLSPYFQKIMLWRVWKEEKLIFSHIPLREDSFRGDFNGNSVVNSVTNIHGHIHQNPSPPGPYKCVCVEQVNYRPVNLEELNADID